MASTKAKQDTENDGTSWIELKRTYTLANSKLRLADAVSDNVEALTIAPLCPGDWRLFVRHRKRKTEVSDLMALCAKAHPTETDLNMHDIKWKKACDGYVLALDSSVLALGSKEFVRS